jgi:ABC-2 type transport system ATP-binding protein
MNATIEIDGLRKRFGSTQALAGMTFTVGPGHVTGFVGPNGAGKSTTMRVVLGLDAPDAGTATIGGRPYRSLKNPLRHVGSLLDAGALQPSRRARNHLLWLAHSQGLKAGRVDEVIAQAGLESAARRRAGGYSLGMRQRLGIAAALLGDPAVLIFDEPFNGMDPEGIVWMKGFLRSLAAQGRAVLVSSHLMSELEALLTDGGAGAVLYLTLIALLSLGLAAALRDSAAAIGLVLGVLYLFPLAADLVANPHLTRHLDQIGPLPAGLDAQATIGVKALPLTPWQGLGVVALWTAGALLLGALVLRFRDA